MADSDFVFHQRVVKNRAALGVAVVAGALLLVVIGAAARGRIVPGQGTAQPSTPPPQAGDCVTEDPNDLGADLYTWTTVLPSVPTEPCNGDRFGEVTAVLPDKTARAVLAGTAADPCRASVDEFLGVQAALPATDGGFSRFDGIPVAVVGPDEEQRAVGQDWAACLVYLPLSGDAAVPLRIDHSLRGAWRHPVDSRLFTVCWEQTVPFLLGNCWAAHPFEVLGAARLPAGTTPETATAACRKFTVATLGSPAALDRGDLDVQLLPIRPDPTEGTLLTGPAAVTPDGDYDTACLATPHDPTRRLTAPLRGLGEAPTPLT
jgi:hypothetical protein